MPDSIFINIGLILGVAIAFSFLAQLLRQPLIVSYIITGVFCGPVFFNLINSSLDFFNILAEFGVVLLLFLVGLSINVDFLKKIGLTAAAIGVSQVLVTFLASWFPLLAFGFDKVTAAYLSIAVAFSSTIIVIKLLGEKKDLRSVYGRYTIGILLIQDIIAILIMILMPALGGQGSLITSLVFIFVKSLSLLLAVYFLARFVIPVFLKRIAGNGEFLFIFSLAWCFFMAGIGEWSGLSLEVGAIMAGLSLGSTMYQIEISARLKPLRDFFIVLFFVILGSEINFDNIGSSIAAGLALSLFVVFAKPLFLYLLFRIGKFTRRNSLLASLNGAQVSEFGFVLLFMASEAGHINNQAMATFTITALVTIFISSYLIKYNLEIYGKLKPILDYLGKDGNHTKKETMAQYDVLVFGYHRLGWKICESLKEIGETFAVVDFDPSAIKKMEERNIPHFFGDLVDVEFLEELDFSKVKMIISTLPKSEDQIALIQHIRQINKKVLIISSLSHTGDLDHIYSSGADYVIVPHLLGGQWISEVLKNESWSRRTFKKHCLRQKKEMELRYTLGHD